MSSLLFGKQTDKSAAPQATGSGPATVARELETSAPPKIAEAADGRALLGRGTRVNGKLSFEGPVRIDGEVDGEIDAKDSVTIGEAAVVTAGIRAGAVLVAGKVSGNMSAAKRIELHRSARVECDLLAPVVVIEEGAQFEGRCSMGSEAGRAERKPTALAQTERLANGAVGQK